MEIFGLHKREFFLHLDFIKTYLNIDSANIYTTLPAPFSPTRGPKYTNHRKKLDDTIAFVFIRAIT